MTVRIQRLEPGEGERWRAIRLRSLEEAPSAFGTKYDDAVLWPAARWQAQVKDLPTFVAVVEGSDVGVARGATHPRDDVRELISMWVAPDARRRGVAGQLIEAVAAWATDGLARVLVLDVMEGNEAALALYERAGFVRPIDVTLGEPAEGELRLVRPLSRR